MAPDNEPTQDFATKRIAATFPRSQWIDLRGLNPASSIGFLSLLGKLSGRTEAQKINWHDGGVGGEGAALHRGSILASHPAAMGLILSIPKIFLLIY